jgi:hypothetical protein
MQHRRSFAVPGDGASPDGDLTRIIEDRNEAEFAEFRHATGPGTVEDGDLSRVGKHAPKHNPFLDCSDEEAPASSRGENGRDPRGA